MIQRCACGVKAAFETVMEIFRKEKNALGGNRTIPSPEDGSERFFREVDIEFLIHELKDPVAWRHRQQKFQPDK